MRLAFAFAAAIVFCAIGYDVVTHGALAVWDVRIVEWLHAHGTTTFNTIMIWVSFSGGPSITSAYAAVLVVTYVTRRRLAAGIAIGTIAYGGALLNIAAKHLVQRGRPVVEDPLMSLPTFSFPSGHAAASTVFGGLACMLLWRSGFQGRPGALAIAAIVLWVALVATSRVYLGLHYPSDVVAGVAEGIVWLTLSFAALDRLRIDVRWSDREPA